VQISRSVAQAFRKMRWLSTRVDIAILVEALTTGAETLRQSSHGIDADHLISGVEDEKC